MGWAVGHKWKKSGVQFPRTKADKGKIHHLQVFHLKKLPLAEAQQFQELSSSFILRLGTLTSS